MTTYNIATVWGRNIEHVINQYNKEAWTAAHCLRRLDYISQHFTAADLTSDELHLYTVARRAITAGAHVKLDPVRSNHLRTVNDTAADYYEGRILARQEDYND